jgi:hypothetical protein
MSNSEILVVRNDAVLSWSGEKDALYGVLRADIGLVELYS